MREIQFCAVGPALERSSCAQLKSRVPYKRDAYKRAMTVVAGPRTMHVG